MAFKMVIFSLILSEYNIFLGEFHYWLVCELLGCIANHIANEECVTPKAMYFATLC